MEIGIERLYHFGEAIAYIIIAFVFLILIKKIADFLVKKEFKADEEIEENSNIAIGIRRLGLYLGFSIGFAGSLSGESLGTLLDTYLLQAADFGLITLFMFISFVISDKVLIPGINNTKAVLAQNSAVACAEAGLFIATGIIAAAAFGGSGSIVSSLVFFGLGQLVLLIMSYLYEFLTKHNVQDELKKGNTSAGVMLGGMLVAISIILHASISGPSNDMIEDIIAFGYSTLMGLFMVLIFFNKAMDKVFFSNTNLEKEIKEDQNLAAILVTVSIKISLAVIIAAVM